MAFQRIVVVYNPRSSGFLRVRDEVLTPLRRRKGVILGKFEILPTNVDENAKNLAKILMDGDIVITAGGDGTATIGLNGIMRSKKRARLAALPYGNFNDAARLLGCRNIEDILAGDETEVYPLVAEIDGKIWRWATCYFTVGMLAESTEAFDAPKIRAKLRKGNRGLFFSIWTLFKWWLGNRKNDFLPGLKKTDILAVNGKTVARIMRNNSEMAFEKTVFWQSVQNLSGFCGIVGFMIRSMFGRIPGEKTRQLSVNFGKPVEVEIQAEGEYVKRKMRTLKIYKNTEPVLMIRRRK